MVCLLTVRSNCPLNIRPVYILHRKDLPHNSGDDMAGIVHSVGTDVYEFKPGDRVAAYHVTGAENGTYAEYSVAPDWTTFHVPHNVSFEEAATIPVAALSAAGALYLDMKVPTPYNLGKPEESGGEKVPILIYGITSAVGAFAAKLARLSGLGPIIGVAGRAGDFAKTLADHVVDYRDGDDALVAAVEKILAKEGLGTKVSNIFDAISEDGSLEVTLRLIDPNGGTIVTVLPPKLFARDKENYKYPPNVKGINSALPRVHSTHKDFGYLWSRYLGRLLEDGRLSAHPYEIIPSGLNGVLTGLKKLRDGQASAVKYVYRIEDTKNAPVLEEANVQATGGPSNRHHASVKDFPFPT
jgi:NADPH2:quinone reductase